MNPLILILAAEIAGPSSAWIQANAPAFLRPGHDIVATQSPTNEQIRAAGIILIPEAQSYFAIVGRADGKNIVFLDAGIDARDFVPGGSHVRQTLRMCDWMLGITLGISRAERAAADLLRAELAAKDAEIARLNVLVIAHSQLAETSAPPPAGTVSDVPVWNPIENVAGIEPELSPETEAAAPANDAPAEPKVPVAPPEPAPDVPAESAPTPVTSSPAPEITVAAENPPPAAPARKQIRDIRRKPSSSAE